MNKLLEKKKELEVKLGKIKDVIKKCIDQGLGIPEYQTHQDALVKIKAELDDVDNQIEDDKRLSILRAFD